MNQLNQVSLNRNRTLKERLRSEFWACCWKPPGVSLGGPIFGVFWLTQTQKKTSFEGPKKAQKFFGHFMSCENCCKLTFFTRLFSLKNAKISVTSVLFCLNWWFRWFSGFTGGGSPPQQFTSTERSKIWERGLVFGIFCSFGQAGSNLGGGAYFGGLRNYAKNWMLNCMAPPFSRRWKVGV